VLCHQWWQTEMRLLPRTSYYHVLLSTLLDCFDDRYIDDGLLKILATWLHNQGISLN
jgi:hypothetical protein